jgi:hypothetical protein
VRDDVQPISMPQMFERAGLRLMRNTVVHSDPGVPRRVLTAWVQNAQDQLIAKASVSDDCLFVLSCALQPYEIAFDMMPALRLVPTAERANFTVDEDGSYIHWPGPDVHIDLDTIGLRLIRRHAPERRLPKLSMTAALERRSPGCAWRRA